MRFRRSSTPQSLVILVAMAWALAAGGPCLGQPGFSGPSISYTAFAETTGGRPGETVRAAFTFALEEGWHVNSHEPLEEYLIPTTLTVTAPDGMQVSSVAYPEHQLYTFSFSPNPVAVYEATFTIGVGLDITPDASPATCPLTGWLRYQACNDRQCAPPKNLQVALDLEIVGPEIAVAKQHEALFAAIPWARAVVPGSPPEETAATSRAGEPAATGEGWQELVTAFEETGRIGYVDADEFLAFLRSGGESRQGEALADKTWWLVFVLIVGGGFLLNLTPCVLPMIPINLAIIGAGARAGSRGRGFALGGAYGLGIALVYGLLGVAVVLGVTQAFGQINATPWFNASIAVMFVVLALAMFDLILIDFSRFQAKLDLEKSGKGGYVLAFTLGGVAALLAGACVAPMVISTLLLSQDLYSQGHAAAVALPLLLGVGMALPWPFAGAGLSLLPRPGQWMVRVKQAFGVLILAFAAYYGYLAYALFSAQEKAPASQMALAQGLARSRAEGKPVLVDFWARWCKNCLVMDQSVLARPEVQEALAEYVLVRYQAEDPGASPVKEVWEHFDLKGLPTFVILRPRDTTRHRPADARPAQTGGG